MRRRLFGAIGLIGLLVVALPGVAAAKARTTRIVGHVSAGSPIKGATVRVYGPTGRRLKVIAKRSVAKTTSDGFFDLVVAGRPKKVRLVATGVKVREEHVKGTLDVFIVRPGIAKDVYINPVTTVIAEVHERHPRKSLTHATREARRLLHLQPTDAIGRELLANTAHFNGHAFMAAARKHGGLASYVDHIIDDNAPVSFRATATAALPFGLDKYKPMLESAKASLQAGYQIGQAAYKFYQWASGEPDDTQKILNAINALVPKLDAIQKSLDVIHDQLTKGLVQLKEAIDETTFNNAVAPLQELAGEVAATQGYFQDLIDNRTAPEFSKELFDVRKADIRENMNDITKKFQGIGNVFRGALLKDGLANPAYYYAGQNLLSHSGYFMTHSGSTQLDQFAQFVLNYQALAFNLILQWENSLGAGDHPSPSTTLKNAIKQYLGFTVEEAKNWLDDNALVETPSVPPTGDLHDEVTYLNTIKAVPAHTVVQADDLGRATGPMWSTDLAPIELGKNTRSRPGEPGMDCSDHLNGSLPLLGMPACEWMARGWDNGQQQLQAAVSVLPQDTFWMAAPPDAAQAFFTRAKEMSAANRERVLALKSDYWYPPEVVTHTAEYHVIKTTGANGQPSQAYCDVNKDAGCSYLATWIDEVILTTLSPTAATLKGTCRLGAGNHRGGTCPVLNVLYWHTSPPDSGDRYWPLY